MILRLPRLVSTVLSCALAFGLTAIIRGEEAVQPAATAPAPAIEAPPAAAPAPAASKDEAAPAAASAAAVAVSPAEEIPGLLKLGETLTERGDFKAAEIAYRRVYKLADTDSDTAASLLGLARMYRKQTAFTKAVAVYEKFCRDYQNDPLLPDALLELGRTQRALGAPKAAVNSFYSVINSSLKVPPDQFQHYQSLARTAQFEIAETHFKSGNYTEAAKLFSRLRLLDLDPADRARAHFMAAYAQKLGGDLPGAVATLHSYLDQSPDDENVPEALYLLSTILRALHRNEEALTTTFTLLQTEQSRTARDPQRWAYWQRRTGNQLANEFFLAGDTMNALAIYRHLSGLSDNKAWRLPLLYQVALCEERLHQVEDARKAYDAIVAGITAEDDGPELADLRRMAAWRLQHLAWRDATDHQLAAVFDTSGGATAKKDPPHHDTPGNPPTSPAGL
ncbi:MAG TPA: tetratricopeptide repeat protein [Opitutus sp.]|nr:tetratricopeptide repeat protein [Opitutus sp.]